MSMSHKTLPNTYYDTVRRMATFARDFRAPGRLRGTRGERPGGHGLLWADPRVLLELRAIPRRRHPAQECKYCLGYGIVQRTPNRAIRTFLECSGGVRVGGSPGDLFSCSS